jgi:transposase
MARSFPACDQISCRVSRTVGRGSGVFRPRTENRAARSTVDDNTFPSTEELQMTNPAGLKRDFEALAKRRLKAVRLLQKKGLKQAEVARRLRVSRQTVSRWMKEFRAGGRKPLKKVGRAGRRPELPEVHRELLLELLLTIPEALGYETSPWTCASVAHLIKEEFGIEYHPGHVWKILDDLGWSWRGQVLMGRRRPNSSADGTSA